MLLDKKYHQETATKRRAPTPKKKERLTRDTLDVSVANIRAKIVSLWVQLGRQIAKLLHPFAHHWQQHATSAAITICNPVGSRCVHLHRDWFLARSVHQFILCFKLRVIFWACWLFIKIYLFFLFLFVSDQQFSIAFFCNSIPVFKFKLRSFRNND